MPVTDRAMSMLSIPIALHSQSINCGVSRRKIAGRLRLIALVKKSSTTVDFEAHTF